MSGPSVGPADTAAAPREHCSKHKYTSHHFPVSQVDGDCVTKNGDLPLSVKRCHII